MRAAGSLPLILLCSVLSGSLVAIGLGQENARSGAADWERRASDRVRQSLSETIDFRFHAIPLREFAKQMSQKYGIEVRLDEPAIRKTGISLDLHLSNGFAKVSARGVFTAMLRKYGLCYRIDPRGIVIGPLPDEPDEELRRQLREAEEEMIQAQHVGEINRDQQQRIFVVRVGGKVALAPPGKPPDPTAALLFYEIVPIQPPVAAPRRDEDERVAGAPPPAPPGRDFRIHVTASTFDSWLIERIPFQPTPAWKLDEKLQARIADIDRRVGLSETQRKKLELAGRGDNQKLLERIDELRQKFETLRARIDLGKDDPSDFLLLYEETQPLRKQIEAGPERPGSLFGRVLKTAVGEIRESEARSKAE